MTVELFPKGDKVDIRLEGNESITVPDGKVWRVTLSGWADDAVYIDETFNSHTLWATTDSVEIPQLEITIHENRTIKTDDIKSLFIFGWEFEYES